MEKSKLAVNPRRVAGKRLRTRFNEFPVDSLSNRYLVVTRVPNPEASRLTLAVTERTTVEGWFELNTELMALYCNGGAMILFDRFIDQNDSLDTVICVASATQGEVDRIMEILIPQDSQDWEELLLEFGDD
jgi:hypothetical protein